MDRYRRSAVNLSLLPPPTVQPQITRVVDEPIIQLPQPQLDPFCVSKGSFTDLIKSTKHLFNNQTGTETERPSPPII